MTFHSIISYRLKEKYKKFKIYKERAEQIQRPAFSIFLINQEQQKGIGNVYRRKSDFMVCCYLQKDDDTDYIKLQEIAEDLYSYFEWFEYKDEHLRGYDMHHRMQDNVLQFFVSLNSIHHKATENPKMEKLKITEK